MAGYRLFLCSRAPDPKQKAQGDIAVSNSCGDVWARAVCYQEFWKTLCLCSADVKNKLTKFMFLKKIMFQAKKIEKVNEKISSTPYLPQDLLQHQDFSCQVRCIWDAGCFCSLRGVKTHLHVRNLSSAVFSMSYSKRAVQIVYRIWFSFHSGNFNPLPPLELKQSLF